MICSKPKCTYTVKSQHTLCLCLCSKSSLTQVNVRSNNIFGTSLWKDRSKPHHFDRWKLLSSEISFSSSHQARTYKGPIHYKHHSSTSSGSCIRPHVRCGRQTGVFTFSGSLCLTCWDNSASQILHLCCCSDLLLKT